MAARKPAAEAAEESPAQERPESEALGEVNGEPMLTHTQAFREVWQTLSQVDCSAHIEQKNGLSYLSWAWAYGILQNYYPGAYITFQQPERYPNDTMMVQCTVFISHGGHELTRWMWLPVMDIRNKAISNPDARAVSDARMRCLTKCLAMFGLGHYIYAGEDLPQELVDVPAPKFYPDPKPSAAPASAGSGAIAPEPEGFGEEPAHDGDGTITSQITTQEGAAYTVDLLLELAKSMHSNNMEALADFWKKNAKIIDLIDHQYNDEYQRLKAGFTGIKQELVAKTPTKE